MQLVIVNDFASVNGGATEVAIERAHRPVQPGAKAFPIEVRAGPQDPSIPNLMV